MSGILFARVLSLRLTKIVVTPARRETTQEVKIWGFLQCALESLGDLLEHVVDAGAGPRRLHHHRFNDE